MKRGMSFIIAGILILFIMVVTYFIPITLHKNINELVKADVQTPLLGILIFHNLFVLIIYAVIAIALIITGIVLKNKH